MKKDSVASSALVTPTEEHRARFKGSRALTGGNRSRAHHDSAPRKVTPGQPGSAPDGTPRAGRENVAAAAGARPGPSPSPVLSPAPLHGTKLGEAVSDRQHSVCGEPLRRASAAAGSGPATQPDPSRCSLSTAPWLLGRTWKRPRLCSRCPCAVFLRLSLFREMDCHSASHVCLHPLHLTCSFWNALSLWFFICFLCWTSVLSCFCLQTSIRHYYK